MSQPEQHPDGPLTVEEYERLPEDDLYRDELVRGHVVREPRAAALYALIQAELSGLLREHVKERALGIVLVDCGYRLFEGAPTVRGPDISFVSSGRIPAKPYGRGFWRMAPDLAVEILSPSNTFSEIQEKVEEYLAAGSLQVWVVDPRRRSVAVYRPGGEARVLGGESTLDGGDVLPGFHLPLAELFDF